MKDEQFLKLVGDLFTKASWSLSASKNTVYAYYNITLKTTTLSIKIEVEYVEYKQEREFDMIRLKSKHDNRFLSECHIIEDLMSMNSPDVVLEKFVMTHISRVMDDYNEAYTLLFNEKGKSDIQIILDYALDSGFKKVNNTYRLGTINLLPRPIQNKVKVNTPNSVFLISSKEELKNIIRNHAS